MTSEKTQVIEWIFFNSKFDVTTGRLVDPVVTMDDLEVGIANTSAALSTANLANFWKDLTRGGAKALNRNWPDKVFKQGFTGTDAIGKSERAVFMFLPFPMGQATPFIESLAFDDTMVAHPLESLSMPQAMKALGRSGENWHAQVTDRLRVVASYFALASPRRVAPKEVREVNFLQTGVKMGKAETDAVFSLLADDGMWLVGAEVKGRREEFHLPQIARSAYELGKAAHKSVTLQEIQGVIPLGIKVVGNSKVWVVEFAPVVGPDSELQKVGEIVFQLTPPVPGVE